MEQKKKLKLRVFSSFKEQEEAELKDVLLQKPLDRVGETVALILRMYGVTGAGMKKDRKPLHINIMSKA